MRRLWQRLVAFFGGYFWIPCDLCGRCFGGHEPSATLLRTPHRGVGVCLNCKARADQLNDEKWKRWRTEEKWWMSYREVAMNCDKHYITHKEPAKDDQCEGGLCILIVFTNDELAKYKTNAERLAILEVKLQIAELSMKDKLGLAD